MSDHVVHTLWRATVGRHAAKLLKMSQYTAPLVIHISPSMGIVAWNVRP